LLLIKTFRDGFMPSKAETDENLNPGLWNMRRAT
jgi:hypothetical protein